MKNLKTVFELLLFPPFLFVIQFTLFQRINILLQKQHARKTIHSLKFLLIIPFLFSLMTIHAVADLDSINDYCPSDENLTIGSGTNTFLGNVGSYDDDDDYYQIIIPADGNITITWLTSQSGKEASLQVGTDCNGTQYYDGDDTNDSRKGMGGGQRGLDKFYHLQMEEPEDE